MSVQWIQTQPEGQAPYKIDDPEAVQFIREAVFYFINHNSSDDTPQLERLLHAMDMGPICFWCGDSMTERDLDGKLLGPGTHPKCVKEAALYSRSACEVCGWIDGEHAPGCARTEGGDSGRQAN